MGRWVMRHWLIRTCDIDLHDLLAEFDDAPSFDNMWDSPGFNTAHHQGAAHAAGTCSALAAADSDEAFATMTHHLADPVLGDHQALLGDDAPTYGELGHLGHSRSVMGEQAFVSVRGLRFSSLHKSWKRCSLAVA